MGWVVNATSRPFYPEERPGTHCIGWWVSPRAGLEGCRESRPPPGSDPHTVQPIASHYTDCAIPTNYIYIYMQATYSIQCTQLATRLSNITTVTTGQKNIGSENAV